MSKHDGFVVFDPTKAGTAARDNTGPFIHIPYDPDTHDFIKQRRVIRDGLNKHLNIQPNHI